MLRQADTSALNGQRDLAEMGFVAAVQASTRTENVEIDNAVCWFGTLDRFTQIVMPACEQAVALADEQYIPYFRDSRGLARALTGNYQGAIDDFAAFAAWAKTNEASAQAGSEREAWIRTLQSGGNPFTDQKLEELRKQ
jgi:hypothetical protein